MRSATECIVDDFDRASKRTTTLTLLHDSVVLLLLGGSLETLPWERASKEVLRVGNGQSAFYIVLQKRVNNA